jgi:hypothetical protein
MIRLSPNVIYNASIKPLIAKDEKTKEVKWPGFRLDHYVKSPNFLVTVTSTADTSKYEPIDRKAGSKHAEQMAAARVTST